MRAAGRATAMRCRAVDLPRAAAPSPASAQEPPSRRCRAAACRRAGASLHAAERSTAEDAATSNANAAATSAVEQAVAAAAATDERGVLATRPRRRTAMEPTIDEKGAQLSTRREGTSAAVSSLRKQGRGRVSSASAARHSHCSRRRGRRARQAHKKKRVVGSDCESAYTSCDIGSPLMFSSRMRACAS